MRVLVACEFSGVVRDAFRARGHNAFSCDFLDSEGDNTYHIKADVREVLSGMLDDDGVTRPWDLMVAHPPCTYLTVAGNRWCNVPGREEKRLDALKFVRELLDAPIPKIALENPVGILNTQIRKPDQIIYPWGYGHERNKSICLWLKNLPKLKPTEIVRHRFSTYHNMGETKDRWKDRSRTLLGIAKAMSEQ